MAVRKCGNCGNPQGPFTRTFVGFPKTGFNLFTCPVPTKDEKGVRIPDAKRREIAMVCNNRREKNFGAAETTDAHGG